MPNTQTLLKQAYGAFNARDIDAALAVMSDSVTWPKASEGGYVVGKAAVRAYWTRQWQEFDPSVEPLEFIECAADKIDVCVHQLVKSLTGETLSDTVVRHTFTIAGGLIQRMDLQGGEANATPSAAFSRP